MKYVFKYIGIGTLVLLLTACGSWSKKDGAAGAGGDGAQTSGVSGRDGYSGRGGANDPLSQRIVYFDYDSSELQSQYRSVILAHAERLRSSGRKVTLEGHSDERGSREYNIALGERRAETVKRIMIASGVSSSQISTISYGEERPAVRSADGQSMAKNRRVEIVY